MHPKWHTPWVAILAQGICTMLMTMTPFPQLVKYIGFTLSFFTAMGVASLFYFRRQPGWKKLAWSASLAAASGPVSDSGSLDGDPGTCRLKPFISLAAVVTMVTGALVYHWTLRSRVPESPAIETY